MKITHRIAVENLGETDREYAQRYVELLTAALQAEYTDAEIDVNLNSDFCNASQTIVDAGEYDPNETVDVIGEVTENVRLIAGLVWDRM